MYLRWTLLSYGHGQSPWPTPTPPHTHTHTHIYTDTRPWDVLVWGSVTLYVPDNHPATRWIVSSTSCSCSGQTEATEFHPLVYMLPEWPWPCPTPTRGRQSGARELSDCSGDCVLCVCVGWITRFNLFTAKGRTRFRLVIDEKAKEHWRNEK